MLGSSTIATIIPPRLASLSSKWSDVFGGRLAFQGLLLALVLLAWGPSLLSGFGLVTDLVLLHNFFPLWVILILVLYPGNNLGVYVLTSFGTIYLFTFGLLLAWGQGPLIPLEVLGVASPWPFFEILGKYEFLLGAQNLMAVDQLSYVFLVLTDLVMALCFLVSRSMVRDNYRQFIYLFLLLQFLLLQFFVSLNLLVFYILFEAILIPMFFIIGIWGGRGRRTFAAYSFFLFTAFGSLLMLLGIGYLFYFFPSLDYFSLLAMLPHFSLGSQLALFFLFFVGFAVKVPMFPFHLWLPEAHVEAPTLGSVLLAGVLLKLGGYGMLRFLIPFFPQALNYSLNFLFLLCVISVLYSAFIGLCQLDMKKIIAYSSITHMNFAVAGLFAGDYLAVQGAIYSMFSHGLISSALFLCVGVLYDRYHSRLLGYYAGLSNVMPLFAGLLFFFTIANVGIPPFSGFISEITVLLGVANVNYFLSFVLFLSSIPMTINFFWFFNRLCCGPVSVHLAQIRDVRWDEALVLLILAGGVILLGIKPSLLFDYCDYAAAYVRSERLPLITILR